jgi:hypothetical protein
MYAHFLAPLYLAQPLLKYKVKIADSQIGKTDFFAF